MASGTRRNATFQLAPQTFVRAMNNAPPSPTVIRKYDPSSKLAQARSGATRAVMASTVTAMSVAARSLRVSDCGTMRGANFTVEPPQQGRADLMEQWVALVQGGQLGVSSRLLFEGCERS